MAISTVKLTLNGNEYVQSIFKIEPLESITYYDDICEASMVADRIMSKVY